MPSSNSNPSARGWLGRVAALSAVILLMLLGLTLHYSHPRLRAERYVEDHLETLTADAQAALAGEALRYDAAILTANVWPGRDGYGPMAEYLLTTDWGRYYGFYYAPDGPHPFQNVPQPLTRSGEGWRWQGEGDNEGYTAPIAGDWYYFEARL